ncbi:MAG: arylformamidase [Betaproteobacteria bacterium]
MKKIWDISPAVDATSAVFPGDTRYTQQDHFTLGPECPVNVSCITLSPHTGAHADAPLHYANGAPAIGAVALEPYLGRCRVIHCLDCGPLIEPRHVGTALQDVPQRVLVRTSQQARQSWEPFTAFAPDTIALLAAHGVRLVGIDTASVDPATSAALDAHHQLLQHDMRVLENLVLDDVPEGDYELIALPLKLTHADASPVRAILRAID